MDADSLECADALIGEIGETANFLEIMFEEVGKMAGPRILCFWVASQQLQIVAVIIIDGGRAMARNRIRASDFMFSGGWVGIWVASQQ